MNWYYAEAGEQRGPITETELSDLAKAGAIRDATLVWREGMPNWQPYGLVKRPTAAPPPKVGDIVCWQCGQMFSREEVTPIGEGFVCAGCKPVYLQRVQESAAATQEYGGFWLRFAAKFIDSLIVGIVVYVPLAILFAILGISSSRSASGEFGAVALVDSG